MKKKFLFLLLLAALFTIALASCSNDNKVTYHIIQLDTNGTTSVSEIVKSGGKITKPADPSKEGYTFAGWLYGDVFWNFETDTVSSDITLKAKFEKNSYTITFTNGDSVSEVNISHGAKITEPEKPTRENYIFLGWYNGDAAWNFETDKVLESINLTAKWQEATVYTVMFDSDGGSPVSTQSVYKNGTVTQPATITKKDHDFAGWFLGDTEWNFAENKVTSNLTLTAKWTPYPTYTVSFNSDGGTEVLPQYIVEGYTAAEPTAPSKVNHKFDGWYNGDSAWSFDTQITDNITLTAKWTVYPTFTVSFDISDIPPLTPPYLVEAQYIYTSGGKVSEPIAPLLSYETNGYRFSGWYISGTDTKWNFDTDIVTQDITLKAKVIKIHHISILPIEGAGNEHTVIEYVENGNLLIRPENPVHPLYPGNLRYVFDNWYSNGNVYDFAAPVTQDLIITAKWIELPLYTVSYDTTQINSVISDYTATSEEVISGYSAAAPQAPEIIPEEHGFIFMGWYITGTDTQWNFETDTVTSNISLTARVLKAHKITIKITEKNSDYVDISYQYVPDGYKLDEPPVPAYPDESLKNKWFFAGWILFEESPYDFDAPVTSDLVIYTDWSPRLPIHDFSKPYTTY